MENTEIHFGKHFMMLSKLREQFNQMFKDLEIKREINFTVGAADHLDTFEEVLDYISNNGMWDCVPDTAVVNRFTQNINRYHILKVSKNHVITALNSENCFCSDELEEISFDDLTIDSKAYFLDAMSELLEPVNWNMEGLNETV